MATISGNDPQCWWNVFADALEATGGRCGPNAPDQLISIETK